jgi:hypothetical protein
MHNKIRSILLKKNKGQGELICSLVAIMAVIVVIFLSIYVAQDISKVQSIDQIARQAIIKVETSGSLTSDQIDSIKTSLTNIGATFDTPADNSTDTPDGVYLMYKDDTGNWKVDTTNEYKSKYGEEVGVYIQCEIYTTTFNGNIFSQTGVFNKTKKQVIRQKYSITKATSSK